MQGRTISQGSDRERVDAVLSNEEVRLRLQAELSLEDPYNGEMVIKNIDKPFVLANEASIIDSWQI